LPVAVSSRRNPNELVGTVTVLRGNDVVKIFTDSV
jgi:hypothetical protein